MRLLPSSLKTFIRVIIVATCRAARVVLTVASNDRDLNGELAGVREIGVLYRFGEHGQPRY